MSGIIDDTIEIYTDILKRNPDDCDSLFSRGLTYGENGNLDKAIEDFEAVLKIDPSYTEAKQLLETFQRYNKAIEDWTAAIKIKPDDQDALFHRGCVYFTIGNYDKAIEDYNAIIKIEPAWEKCIVS